MPGVREGLRWVLADAPDVVVSGEAATVAEAAGAEVVVVTGLLLDDGCAADVARAVSAPVVVHTWLPPDERDPAWTAGVAAVVRHGRLRSDLAPAIRAAAGRARG